VNVFAGKDGRTTVFLHIAKTGGTTLGFPLRHLYGLRSSIHVGRPPRAYLQLSPAEKRSVRLIKGHHDFGLHEHAPVPCTYITILRDPIRRMASMHRMMKKEWPGYDVAEMSLAEFVRFDHPASRANAQALQVAGASPEEAAMDPAGVLERAKAHIDEHFAVAGITKRFDETIMLMKRRLDWPRLPYYVTSRVGKKTASAGQSPSQRESMDADVRSLIAEENALDLKLYAYVRDRFAAEVERAGDAFQEEVRAFQESNRRIAPFLAPPLTVSRKIRHAFRVWSS